MPIPEFNEIKAPAMQFFADGKPHKVSEIYDVLAKHFNLTEEELNEVLPSGTHAGGTTEPIGPVTIYIVLGCSTDPRGASM